MEMEQVQKSAEVGSAIGADAPGVGEDSTILFPQGLPGFPAATRFALRPLANGPQSLLLLQSVDDPDLRTMATAAWRIAELNGAVAPKKLSHDHTSGGAPVAAVAVYLPSEDNGGAAAALPVAAAPAAPKG